MKINFGLIKDKEISDKYFKAILKTYAVVIDADDYSTFNEFTLWKKQIKTKPIKNLCNYFSYI